MKDFSITGTYTDLYQLTMGQVYFLKGAFQQEAVFDYFFRKIPFDGGYVVFAGLGDVLPLLHDLHFSEEDLAYLKAIGLHRDFVEYLRNFRFRGTVRGLRRFISLYVGVDVIVLERFRMRGRMAALLGDPLGTTADAHAHRFTVLIPTSLTEEQLDVVRRILEVHRPAHTLFDVCTVGAGMRTGRGLHVGVSSIVGATGGFSTLQLGADPIGRGAILGRPSGATAPSASRLGITTGLR